MTKYYLDDTQLARVKGKIEQMIEDGGGYTLPPATTATLGGVKPDGTTITVDQDGTIHGSSSYELPTMAANVKGGAKLGSGLEVSNDALSLSPATANAIGGVKPDGTTITIAQDGTITASGGGGGGYVLPTASTSQLGGVKIDGDTITIDGNGVISSGIVEGYSPSDSRHVRLRNGATEDEIRILDGFRHLEASFDLSGYRIVGLDSSSKTITFENADGDSYTIRNSFNMDNRSTYWMRYVYGSEDRKIDAIYTFSGASTWSSTFETSHLVVDESIVGTPTELMKAMAVGAQQCVSDIYAAFGVASETAVASYWTFEDARLSSAVLKLGVEAEAVVFYYPQLQDAYASYIDVYQVEQGKVYHIAAAGYDAPLNIAAAVTTALDYPGPDSSNERAELPDCHVIKYWNSGQGALDEVFSPLVDGYMMVPYFYGLSRPTVSVITAFSSADMVPMTDAEIDAITGGTGYDDGDEVEY